MKESSQNMLYPVFFRLDKLKILVVGAGEVGEEKMHFILKSSPNANITIVATWVGDGVAEILKAYADSNVVVNIKAVEESDVVGHDLIVAATCFHDVNMEVYQWAKKHGKIINVADTPDLCDFYMGSIVTKGDLKIAISTNGKSPTFSKRFRQYLESVLDDDTADLIENLKKVRDKMDLDFKQKVSELNKITEKLIE
ncbi:MAG: bifunctional precorrin-2 dehydrogenase/sirohydrochlorin ferrochelatase [Saprospiraceae bacterium]